MLPTAKPAKFTCALMQQLYSQSDSEILLPDERKGFDSSDGGG